MPIFVTFAGIALREVTFYVSHVVFFPHPRGEFPMPQVNPMQPWDPPATGRGRQGRVEADADAGAESAHSRSLTLSLIINNKEDIIAKKIQLAGSASLRTFGREDS
jgi:hypothetical protein